jgi:hypothetical protein
VHDLRLVAAFAFHTVAAVALFGLIGGAAALLAYYTRFLSGLGLSPLIVEAIHLFAADLICFVIYVSREAWMLIRHMLAPHAPGAAPLPGH